MPPTRRSGAAAQKKTLPSSHDEDVAFATSERANSEFETELSGAFRLLSVEGSPSKVRTSDLGKLLRAIGAGEIAEMKPLENIVDINHSGFFTREKVRRFYRSLVQGNENFCRFAISVSTRAATTRTERGRFLVEFKCIVTDIACFFCLRSPPPWKNSENKGVSPRWTSSPVAPPLGVKRRRRPKTSSNKRGYTTRKK